MSTIRTLVLAVLLLTGSISFGQNQLRGDPEAVALIDKLLERLGGRDIWARTRTLYVEYHGWRKDPAQAVVERAWRDLQQPNQRMEIEGSLVELTFVFTPDSGWLNRNGVVEDVDANTHQADLNFWPYDFYTVIHNLAVADPRLRVSFEAPMRVNIFNEDGSSWGWWEIDATGAPIRWGANYEDEVLEYIYGPIRSYGNINFPAWGTAVDGFWRFDYVDVDVATSTIPEQLLLRP